MAEFTTEQVTTSVNRALWGEVTDRLRCVRFRTSGQRIDLRFFFDGAPEDDDQDTTATVGAEVAAEAIGTSAGPSAHEAGWHVVYARNEPSLAG